MALTALEYQNAIRDLLALEIDAAASLPATKPTMLRQCTPRRFVPDTAGPLHTAAQKISRLQSAGRRELLTATLPAAAG